MHSYMHFLELVHKETYVQTYIGTHFDKSSLKKWNFVAVKLRKMSTQDGNEPTCLLF